MAVDVQTVSTPELEVPTPAPLEFKVLFNPTAEDNGQFTFEDPSGAAVTNYILIEDDSAMISVTLVNENVQFSAESVTWSAPPDIRPDVTHSNLGKTISFTVPQPKHYLLPWIFRLSVDFQGVVGILSRTIFLVRQTALDLTLEYSPGDGNFALLGGDSTIPSINLTNELVLMNLLPNTFQVTLISSLTPPPTFHLVNAMLFSSGSEPGWISRAITPDGLLTFTIDQDGPGQTVGFRFGIVRQTDEGKTMTIFSPDPILINATIGDGT